MFTEFAEDLFQINTEFKLKFIQNNLQDKLNKCLNKNNQEVQRRAETLLNIIEYENFTY